MLQRQPCFLCRRKVDLRLPKIAPIKQSLRQGRDQPTGGTARASSPSPASLFRSHPLGLASLRAAAHEESTQLVEDALDQPQILRNDFRAALHLLPEFEMLA